jgi:hypothetical protein
MVKTKENKKFEIVKVKKSFPTTLVLTIWHDKDTDSLLWDYGNSDIDLKNIHELIGMLETIQYDLFNKLNEEN